MVLFLPRVLTPEKLPTRDLSQFGPQASPRVSHDLLTDSKFYAQSHFSTYQPGLNCPLLPEVMLARDPDSDLISPCLSAHPEPAPACPDLWAPCWSGGQSRADRDRADWIYVASQCRLLSFRIPFSQLEGALSKWTSYQDDVRQFSSWMDSVEASLNESERQYAELREKTASLGKAKVGAGFQTPFVLQQAFSECLSYVKI